MIRSIFFIFAILMFLVNSYFLLDNYHDGDTNGMILSLFGAICFLFPMYRDD